LKEGNLERGTFGIAAGADDFLRNDPRGGQQVEKRPKPWGLAPRGKKKNPTRNSKYN